MKKILLTSVILAVLLTIGLWVNREPMKTFISSEEFRTELMPGEIPAEYYDGEK